MKSKRYDLVFNLFIGKNGKGYILLGKNRIFRYEKYWCVYAPKILAAILSYDLLSVFINFEFE